MPLNNHFQVKTFLKILCVSIFLYILTDSFVNGNFSDYSETFFVSIIIYAFSISGSVEVKTVQGIVHDATDDSV